VIRTTEFLRLTTGSVPERIKVGGNTIIACTIAVNLAYSVNFKSDTFQLCLGDKTIVGFLGVNFRFGQRTGPSHPFDSPRISKINLNEAKCLL